VAVWVAAAFYPRARTPGMPPRPRIEIPAKQYDFRDDVQPIMQMLRKRYKSKD